jgi:squalene monooxygenase
MPPQRVASKTRDARGSAARAQVPAQLQEAFLGAVGAGRVRSMQNKLMPAAPLHRPGALLLGDAFNMRHPLTGAGRAVILGFLGFHARPLMKAP